MTEITIAFEPRAHARARRAAQALKKPPRRYPTRVARQLALSHALRRRLDAGELADYVDMARALGFMRARITQMMNLLLLAPAIQQEILFLESPAGEQPICERMLRNKVLKSIDWKEQQRRWDSLRRSTPALQRPEES